MGGVETIDTTPTKYSIPQNSELSSGLEAKFFLSDADYIKAVESGDMKTVQKMVEEAARKWSAGDSELSFAPETLNLALRLCISDIKII